MDDLITLKCKLHLLGVSTYFYYADKLWYAFTAPPEYKLCRNKRTMKALAEETELELVQKVLENLK